jgi:large subunit ribosomal protein L30e
MDLNHALKVALQTGKVRLGVRETMEVAEAKGAKLIIVSTSCPEPKLTVPKKFGTIPIFKFDGNAVELGAACGQPFPISALAVVEAGSSAILTLSTG